MQHQIAYGRPCAAVGVLACAAVVQATPFPITINSSQSNVSVQLCLTVNNVSRCSTDTSRVAGESWVKLQPVLTPSQVTLYDFTFSLLDTIDLVLNYGNFVGRLEIHTQPPPNNLVLTYPTPFVPLPPVPVAQDGSFVYNDVPANPSGLVNYSATLLVCLFLQAQTPPIPCSGTINAADNGTQTATLSATVTVSPQRVVSAVVMPNVSVPLDPNNPSLGTLTITGTIRGSATLPLRGDANLDNVVDAGDLQAFVDILLDPQAATWQQRFAVDVNDDDAFDALDAAAMAACLVNGECPE